MFLLAKPEEIRRVAELCFDLFLAVPKIVVGNDRHHDPSLVTTGEFECVAVVVRLTLILPTRPIAALALGGLIPMWQANRFFCDPWRITLTGAMGLIATSHVRFSETVSEGPIA